MAVLGSVDMYITTAQIAEILDSPDDPWSTRRARKWLLRTGAYVRHAKRGHIKTTPELLRAHWPEVFMRVEGFDDE